MCYLQLAQVELSHPFYGQYMHYMAVFKRKCTHKASVFKCFMLLHKKVLVDFK